MAPQNRFLFVADDFGLSNEVNQSILLAHREGVLSHAALMMGQTGTEEAIALALAQPSLAIGLHFHFFDSIPTLLPKQPSTQSPESFGFQMTWSSQIKANILEEMQSQWDLFQKSGLPLTFVNVHHHLHAHPWLAHVLGKFLKKNHFTGWIRAGYPRFFSKSLFQQMASLPLIYFMRKKNPYPTPDSLWGIDRCFSMNASEIQNEISRLTSGNHEFIFHPRHPHDQDTQCLIQLKTLLKPPCL